MSDTWTAVDGFVEETLHADDPALAEAMAASGAAGLPPIQLSAPLAKMLHLIASSIRAERILEIGTLGGYSGIWLARALPPAGRLVTIEVSRQHADVARSNFERADVADQVDLRVGAALDVLPVIEQEDAGPFDMTFIDADKSNNSAYLEWAVRLSRPGAVIVLDNVVRGGAVAAATDKSGARAAITWMGAQPRIDSTVVQTVGTKGYDGFAIAVVK